MVQFNDLITEELKEWALKQSVFFVASAPLAGNHVNVSPKGLPASSLSILSPSQVAYVDATGSGCETISHVYENGRVTLMFCSFDASPRIMRFFCKGRVVECDQPEFNILLAKIGDNTLGGARAIIVLDVFKAQTSCGYGVPRMVKRSVEVKDVDESTAGFADRETLGNWASKLVEKNGMEAYQIKNNSNSLDGLPGLRLARRGNGEILWLTDLAAWLGRISLQREAVGCGFVLALLLVAVIHTLGAISL